MKDTDTEPIHVGTSGWTYTHWKRRFYPADLPSAQWLAYYADRFPTVEVNSSFYRLPTRRTLIRWRDSVQQSFLFAIKASRYITHMRKFADPRRSVHTLLQRVAVLEDRLGPILFQLPPHWRVNVERLDGFLRVLSHDFRYAFEFRDRTWINDDVLDVLNRHGVAFCIYDLDGYLSPKLVTTNFVYVRLHGPGGPYKGSYDQQTLSDWANTFTAWTAEGHQVFCYFDNDECAHAVSNAALLQDLVGR